MIFVTGLTAISALLLSILYTSLRDRHEFNEAIYNKRAILSSIEDHLDRNVRDLSGAEVQMLFDDRIEQVVVDNNGDQIPGLMSDDIDLARERKKPVSEMRLPVYIYSAPEGQFYIVSVRGNGLWDEIWGSIALEEDLNTIAGVAFDHAGETPGLGAEIKDNAGFSRQFVGKKIYDDTGVYVSVEVKKRGARNQEHEVDGISGATITCNGVTEMMERGIQYYEAYFDKLKTH